MLNLRGLTIDGSPMRNMSHVSDLLYYDGPILSHLTDSRGNHFLQHWCDDDENHNRWAIMRITEAMILRLRHNVLPLNLVVPDQILDDFVYYIDVDSEGRTASSTRVWTEDIPEEYLPLPGSYCDKPEALDNEFTVLIDGAWSLQEWGQFPFRFSQVYSVLYGHRVLRTPHYKSYPWKEGFSSMHFYKDAVKGVPLGDRANINALQYSSPGFIRFSSNREVSASVVSCVIDLNNNHEAIADAASDVDTMCRAEGLNKAEAVQKTTPDQNEKLVLLAKRLLSQFSAIDSDRFVQACPSAFEAAKIAVSFYKRVADLRRFERNEQICFPRPTAR